MSLELHELLSSGENTIRNFYKTFEDEKCNSQFLQDFLKQLVRQI